MIPGEIFPARGQITLNQGRESITLHVSNTGDRPIQIGSHYHFFETNEALDFDRGQSWDFVWIFRRGRRRALSLARRGR